MRIKEVCKETGLTDKAVRLYINNELIHPSFQEGYNGRRNYNFSEDDVSILKRIALLRRYNFSIQTIKEMFDDNDCISEVLENHLFNTKQTLAESSMVLTNLNNAYNSSVSNLDDLCDVLSQNLEPVDFDLMSTVKDAWNKIKKKIPLFITVIALGVVITIILLVVITIFLTKLFLSLS
ncbi:MAG: MerR family transcriptional regulator [Eubacterium sp.]